MGATAIAATVTDPSLFRSGRKLAARLGMTTRQNSSGGEERLGCTGKRGDKYIRCPLISDAVAVPRHTRNRPHQGRRLGAGTAGAATRQGSGRGAGEQGRAHRLGGDDTRGSGYAKDAIALAA